MCSVTGHVQLFSTLWTTASQVPLSMGFSRREYWSVLPCHPPGNIPDPGIKPKFPACPALQANSLPLVPPGKHIEKSKQLLPYHIHRNYSVNYQFSSVAQSCPTLCDPVNRSTPGLRVHHQLSELTPKLMFIESVMPSSYLILCCPLLLLPPVPRSQGLFQWVNSSHEVPKVLEFQLQHQSFKWTPRTGLL